MFNHFSNSVCIPLQFFHSSYQLIHINRFWLIIVDDWCQQIDCDSKQEHDQSQKAECHSELGVHPLRWVLFVVNDYSSWRSSLLSVFLFFDYFESLLGWRLLDLVPARVWEDGRARVVLRFGLDWVSISNLLLVSFHNTISNKLIIIK